MGAVGWGWGLGGVGGVSCGKGRDGMMDGWEGVCDLVCMIYGMYDQYSVFSYYEFVACFILDLIRQITSLYFD